MFVQKFYYAGRAWQREQPIVLEKFFVVRIEKRLFIGLITIIILLIISAFSYIYFCGAPWDRVSAEAAAKLYADTRMFAHYSVVKTVFNRSDRTYNIDLSAPDANFQGEVKVTLNSKGVNVVIVKSFNVELTP